MASRRLLPLLATAPLAAALDNGLGRTPQMGYNTWYDVECSGMMNESFVKLSADALVSRGLAALGYKYVNLDDCWAVDRQGPNGRVRADPKKFPSATLKPLADYAHSKGLLFGTYTDRGDKTCAGRPGALGKEELDAETYADWGVDYLKEDSCNAPSDHAKAFAEYGAMRDALNKTGRPIFFSLCGWEAWYAPKGSTLGNSWRVGPDDNDWHGILTNIDIMAGLAEYAGPGGWNDPCMLLSSRSDSPKRRVTELQSRAQFSMWAVMAAPLLISGSVVYMTPMDFETYSNKDVIAVSQDPLGQQGSRLVGGPLQPGSVNVWGRKLQDSSAAVVFVNSGKEAAAAKCDADCFKALGFESTDRLVTKDLWNKTSAPEVLAQPVLADSALPPHGGHRMWRVSKASGTEAVLVV